MADPRDFEPRILSHVRGMFSRWLELVRRLVMRDRLHPDPSAVDATRTAWNAEVADLLPELAHVAGAAWELQSGQDFIEVDSFVIAQLQLTQNLLVRIPDEVYRLIFQAIEAGHRAGEDVEQIAQRVDAVLTFTGSENWDNRAKVIAVTETHRAWQSGTLGAAMYYEPPTGRGWTKTWAAEEDDRTRPAHVRADGQTRRLRDMFQVGGEDLAYPGDPRGLAANVIACRCDLIIKEA